MNPIELRQLSKFYGTHRGVESIDLSIPQGVAFGLIGPNGAGKSTAMRTLLGLLLPTSGSAWLLGHDVRHEAVIARANTGYVPGENQFDSGLSVSEVLEWRSQFHPGTDLTRRKQLAERFDLDLKARAEDLSLGNKKKLALVAALQHRPQVLVLDEPTNGLDPLMQQRLFELLQAETRDGVTVLFSSHVLSEVQSVCKTVAVLREGRLVAVEDVEGLRKRQLREVELTLASTPSSLQALAGVTRWQSAGERHSFLYAGTLQPLLQSLAALAPVDLRIDEPSLEEIVMTYYRTEPEVTHA